MECLLQGKLHSEAAIAQAVRKSLKGEPAFIAKRQGSQAGTRDILKRLEDIYGIVDAGETLLAEFYIAHQKPDEDVSSWGCRLEGLLDKAQQRVDLKDANVNEMLRSRFWNGLNQRLKDSSRHKHDTVKDFDKLRKEIRTIEKEYKVSGDKDTQTQKTHAKMVTVSDASDEASTVKTLSGLMSRLSTQVDAIQRRLDGKSSQEGAGIGQGQVSAMGTGMGRGMGPANGPQIGPYGTPSLGPGMGRGIGPRCPGQVGVGPKGVGPGGSRYPEPGGTGPSGSRYPGPGGTGPSGSQYPGQSVGIGQGGTQQQWGPPQPQTSGQGGQPGQQYSGHFGQGGSGFTTGSDGGPQCYKCGMQGHFKRDCPRIYEPTCFGCGQIGHVQRQCQAQQLNY